MTASPIIRSASTDDVDMLSDLEERLYKGLGYPGFLFRQLLDAFGSGLWVAEDGGRIVGYVIAVRADDGVTGWIWSVGVTPDHRGRGIGRTLVQHSLNRMRTTGIERVLLTVAHDNVAAVTLYKSLHFEVCRTESNYFGPGEDRLVRQPGFVM